jgi:hypothetical protein
MSETGHVVAVTERYLGSELRDAHVSGDAVLE